MHNLAFSLLLLVYFASGISLTCYNKYFLTAKHYGFTYPFTLIFCHMSINCLLSWVTLRWCFWQQLKHSPFHPTNMTRSLFLSNFLPIGLLFGTDITLTNVAFRYLSVSLTEVVKSAIPALIFIYNFMRGRDATPSLSLKFAKLLNVLLICAGVSFTAYGEADLNMKGFVAAVGATIAATWRWLLIEDLLLLDVDDIASSSNEEGSGSINVNSRLTSPTPKLVRVQPVVDQPDDNDGNDLANPTTPTRRASMNGIAPKMNYAPVGTSDLEDHVDQRNGSDSNAYSLSPGSLNGSADPNALHTHTNRHPHHAHGRLHPILSLFYFTPVSALALIPCQLLFEQSELVHSKFVDSGVWEPTLALIIAGSIVAFGLNSSELFMVQATSALTLCIFGVLKFLVVIILSVIFFQYEVTTVNRIGIVLTMLGLIVYNYGKWKESQMKAAATLEGTITFVPHHPHHHHHTESALDDSMQHDLQTHDIDLALDHTGRMILSNGNNEGPSPASIRRHHLTETNHLQDDINSSSSSSSSSVGSIDVLLPSSPSHKRPKSRSPSSSKETPSATSDTAIPSSHDLGSRLVRAINSDEHSLTEDETLGDLLDQVDYNHKPLSS